MSVRKGEPDSIHFRSERLECLNGKWFFSTRESEKLVGPFDTHEQAEKAALAYAQDMSEGKTEVNAMSHQYLNKAFGLNK